MQQHDVELQQRFRGVDYVSELQRIWAYFNKWYKAETRGSLDRDCIDAIKGVSSRGTQRTHRVKDAISELLEVGSPDHRLFITLHAVQKDYYRYLVETEASTFIRECWGNSKIRPILNLFGTPPPTGPHKPRPTSTIHLSVDEFITLYSCCAKLTAEFIDQEPITVSSVLHYNGIRFSGSSFFKDPAIPTKPQSIHLEACWEEIGQSLPILPELAKSQAALGFHADVCEMIYLARNLSVHGDLDHLNPSDNDAAKAGYYLMAQIISSILNPSR